MIDASLFAGGNGSQESPYQIQNADQLRAFAGSLSEHIDYSGTFIALTDDIDLSGTEWTPIGNSTYAFNGTFDGNGHTISGMTIGSATDAKALAAGENYLGLFSVLNTNAVVRNVKLTGVLINVTYNASAYAGGIAAAMNSDDTGYKGAVVDIAPSMAASPSPRKPAIILSAVLRLMSTRAPSSTAKQMSMLPAP